VDSFWRSMKRFGRAVVSILIGGTAAYVAQDTKLLILAPIVQAVGKWLRDKLGLRFIPF